MQLDLGVDYTLADQARLRVLGAKPVPLEVLCGDNDFSMETVLETSAKPARDGYVDLTITPTPSKRFVEIKFDDTEIVTFIDFKLNLVV